MYEIIHHINQVGKEIHSENLPQSFCELLRSTIYPTLSSPRFLWRPRNTKQEKLLLVDKHAQDEKQQMVYNRSSPTGNPVLRRNPPHHCSYLGFARNSQFRRWKMKAEVLIFIWWQFVNCYVTKVNYVILLLNLRPLL